ncbi:MAG: NAD(+)--dinitrogen-reductase ADP-D-ribosyltransferase [Hydrogenophilales bacterium]|nr:NAD(+)--dinitrogen-reductase ADP-D-ribosyltransferase [Hydrogenophilales bacterium]
MAGALRRHGANLVGVPTGLLAAAAFNDFPQPLQIRGVREAHASLFEQLAACDGASNSARCFQGYMDITFNLRALPGHGRTLAPRRFRASYLRLLKGWGYNANSREGAVLKGWVENRFGLFPTFHKKPLIHYASPTWLTYVEEKMASRFHNNTIYQQLDLLYEFCQWSITRWFYAGRRHVTLYRGVNHFLEDRPLPAMPHPRMGNIVAHLNNISSFTADRNIACEFGDYILEAQVPAAKILFFNDLLPRHPLKGEAEYLVIGGDYRLRVDYL